MNTMGAITRLSPWLRLGVSAAELRADTTLNCGQSFRWVASGEHEWSAALWGCLVSIKQTDSDIYFRTSGDPEETRDCLNDYFQLKVKLADLYDAWRTDVNFKKKAGNLAGIRILRQDPIENVFSFICTSNNNIGRITSMVNALCSNFGPKIGTIEKEDRTIELHAFPSVKRLSETDVEAKLRVLGFGYRAKYIHQTAAMIVRKCESEALDPEQYLVGLRNLASKEEKREELLKLSGVGPKVADCILLMSLDCPDSIPVDTHVYQIAVRDYGLKTLKSKTLTPATYEQISNTFKLVFGPYAGWAHSVLFTADLRQFRDRLAPGKPVSGGPSPREDTQATETKPDSLPGSIAGSTLDDAADTTRSEQASPAPSPRLRKRKSPPDTGNDSASTPSTRSNSPEPSAQPRRSKRSSRRIDR
ncbi:N-glycosylase/DNA lyase [Polychytrium aggregatum]|uniref:N-glycosylase/DNA lyase n=1 Tax=Polychytrium aggregatum TaxID=110093 RepID=UPI0022FF0EF3|nr:N-glycosylase/DNA lyase [Polychytrium aggregatum]KAI9203147.1 N-glycosylase/DNA lyase [Polychytrium aggregatum]